MSWFEVISRSFFDWRAMADVLPNMVFVGLKNTLLLAIASTLLGIVIGMVLAVMGISRSAWIRAPARVYTDIFRGLPAIVTILLIGQGLARLGRQIFGPSPYPLGILALSLIAGAYIGEIFRSGIQSVERGQLEACRALGMTYALGMRLVVIPQGVRRVLPALVNQFIGNIKDSSLVYFLGLLASERELFRVGQDEAVVSGNLSPLMLAGIFYLLITVPLTHVVNAIDNRLRAGRRIKAVSSGLEEVSEVADAARRANALSASASGSLLDQAMPQKVAASGGRSAVGARKGASLEVNDLDMSYGDFQVLRRVNLRVEAGAITCVIGPSGSGKSTLLRCINRLVEPSGGDIRLDGQSVLGVKQDALRRRVGMVFQHFNLFPDHTALGNVALALRKVQCMPAAAAQRIATERLAEVGLSARIHHRPIDLSGGQQQRVAIARALALQPELMLFDEVTSALDPELVKGVLNLMAELGRSGMTMVVVTHEMNFARRVADQVVFMDEGVVVETGSPEAIFDNPQSPRLKRFLSEML
ncbi:amino acid ABC transporter permease/ATP-binding protein [Methylocapsa sp. S129]|uniref:amino acid ABC transporter permease/ATP-binding protein n=1 Tax=Methylocapsa sp. S129 TaxID=1641869 RepID=UPI00131BE4C7|nr:amino acid ABC transporter permease/ATP-binding protein [Methylocapsa sp. S129]